MVARLVVLIVGWIRRRLGTSDAIAIEMIQHSHHMLTVDCHYDSSTKYRSISNTQNYVPITTFVQFSASVWSILCNLSNDIVGTSATIDGAIGRSAFAIRRHIGHGYSPRLTRRLICCNRSSCNNNASHHQSRFAMLWSILLTCNVRIYSRWQSTWIWCEHGFTSILANR